MNVVAFKRPASDQEDREWEELVNWLVEQNFSPTFIRSACQEHVLRTKHNGIDPLCMA